MALKIAVLFLGLALASVALWRAFKFGRNKFDEPTASVQPTFIWMAVGLLLATVTGMVSIGEIPAGSRGVVLHFGAPTNQILAPGLYTVAPFISSVAEINVQTQAYSAEASAASHDLQDVHTTITLNWSISPDAAVTVYRDLANDALDRVVKPAAQESVKAATANYTAEGLVTERAHVRNDIEALLATRLQQFGLRAEALSITNFAFSPEFAQAIEQKAVAAQQVVTAGRNLERIRVEAQQRIAQAQAEAQALTLQKQAVTPELVALRRIEAQMKAIEKWNGQMPTIVTGSGPVPILDVFRP